MYQKSFGVFYAVNSITNTFILSGDTYEEVFNELSYIIAEK